MRDEQPDGAGSADPTHRGMARCARGVERAYRPSLRPPRGQGAGRSLPLRPARSGRAQEWLADGRAPRREDARRRPLSEVLNAARWDHGEVRDDLREYVVGYFGDPAATLVIDETSFLKKGEKSVGVARQYSGTAGKVENCQVGVFLAYAAPNGGRAFLDRALYLPEEEWALDGERLREAGVPEEQMGFAKKGELARRMLERAFDAGVPASWVTGEEVYGQSTKLRRWLEGKGKGPPGRWGGCA